MRKYPFIDTHLKDTLKLAVKNHLLKENIIEMAVKESWGREEADLLALVISDVPSTSSAEFLLGHISKHPQPEDRLLAFATSIARSLPSSEMGRLIDFVEKQYSGEVDLQYKIALATEQGMEQRGGEMHPLLKNW
jgi:hypothetical protein